MLTFEDFARKAGFELVECEPSWGGRIAYRTKDHPNCTTCGFRTESAARRCWAEETFGRNAAKALLQLFRSRA